MLAAADYALARIHNQAGDCAILVLHHKFAQTTTRPESAEAADLPTVCSTDVLSVDAITEY